MAYICNIQRGQGNSLKIIWTKSAENNVIESVNTNKLVSNIRFIFFLYMLHHLINLEV